MHESFIKNAFSELISPHGHFHIFRFKGLSLRRIYFSAAQDSQSFFNAGNQSVFFCPLSFNFLPLFFEGRQIWGFHFAMRNVCIGPQSIYIRTVRTLQNWFKLVYGPFGQSNMHHTLDLCPNQAARKESNVPKLKSSSGLTVFSIYCIRTRGRRGFFLLSLIRNKFLFYFACIFQIVCDPMG